ncbi:hypothetical protein C8R43DRAFT_1119923 [Mycena crocata]|nr:hypothetical protein C8R43DRAFT_1119923 [Mycena crocata]
MLGSEITGNSVAIRATKGSEKSFVEIFAVYEGVLQTDVSTSFFTKPLVVITLSINFSINVAQSAYSPCKTRPLSLCPSPSVKNSPRSYTSPYHRSPSLLPLSPSSLFKFTGVLPQYPAFRPIRIVTADLSSPLTVWRYPTSAISTTAADTKASAYSSLVVRAWLTDEMRRYVEKGWRTMLWIKNFALSPRQIPSRRCMRFVKTSDSKMNSTTRIRLQIHAKNTALRPPACCSLRDPPRSELLYAQTQIPRSEPQPTRVGLDPP